MRRHEALLQRITERSHNVLWLLPAWEDAGKLLSDCIAAAGHIEEAPLRLSFALRNDAPRSAAVELDPLQDVMRVIFSQEV